MRRAGMGSIKYIYRDYDARGEYKEGEYVTFRWHRRWQIVKVTWSLAKGRTSIKLIKVNDRGEK